MTWNWNQSCDGQVLSLGHVGDTRAWGLSKVGELNLRSLTSKEKNLEVGWKSQDLWVLAVGIKYILRKHPQFWSQIFS